MSLPLSAPSDQLCALQIDCVSTSSRRMNSADRVWLISVSWIQEHCERLHYQQVQGATSVYAWVSFDFFDKIPTIYLVVCWDQLSHGMKGPRSHKFMQTYRTFKGEQLLRLFLGFPALLSQFLCLLHDLPYLLWNGPMVNFHVCSLTLFFIALVMLTEMETAGRVPALEESLALALRFYEHFVVPGF